MELNCQKEFNYQMEELHQLLTFMVLTMILVGILDFNRTIYIPTQLIDDVQGLVEFRRAWSIDIWSGAFNIGNEIIQQSSFEDMLNEMKNFDVGFVRKNKFEKDLEEKFKGRFFLSYGSLNENDSFNSCGDEIYIIKKRK